MHSLRALSPVELTEFLLAVAPRRPVMIWGQPGIGKTALVQQFFNEVGLECQSLLGSQLAPEDLMGVPQIVNGKTRFCPPGMIARDEPYGLFLDEINAVTPDVSRSMYSLVFEQRVGEYTMPKGSVVIAAGNRAQDQAIVRTMPSPLINRMVHVELTVSHREWLAWAQGAGLATVVTDYIATRPDHLVSPPSKRQEPFSTPRSWEYVSDGLKGFGVDSITDAQIASVVNGLLTPAHAQAFRAYLKQVRRKYSIVRILDGDERWPSDPSDRDVLYFLAQSLRGHLLKQLPSEKARVTGDGQTLAHNAKARIRELAEISLEAAQAVIAPDEHLGKLAPWFLAEIARDIPRIVARDDAAPSA